LNRNPWKINSFHCSPRVETAPIKAFGLTRAGGPSGDTGDGGCSTARWRRRWHFSGELVTRGRGGSPGDAGEVQNPFWATGAGKAHRRRRSKAVHGRSKMDTGWGRRRARRRWWIGQRAAQHPGGARGGASKVGRPTGRAVHEEPLRQWGGSSLCFGGLRPDGLGWPWSSARSCGTRRLGGRSGQLRVMDDSPRRALAAARRWSGIYPV
jgi:hypothetical protein